ncbi:hypothetical protein GCM10023314_12900 [Algibacter agarivorans]|uniref:Uncharacterized protein n=1 Tax=Algibacter agarivorans TaxID=1109741 RepID=A0ABP9GH89_9FLAO
MEYIASNLSTKKNSNGKTIKGIKYAMENDSEDDTVLKISSMEYPKRSAPKLSKVVKLYFTSEN